MLIFLCFLRLIDACWLPFSQKDVGALVFDNVGSASRCSPTRDSCASGYLVRRVHSRIRERDSSCRLPDTTAPHLRGRTSTSPSPLPRPARRSRRSSHVGTRVPDVRRQGTGLGTGLRDERHVHRVRLGRPLRRARARMCACAARASPRPRRLAEARASPSASRRSRRSTTESLAADPRSPRKRQGARALRGARVPRPRARRRRTRSVSLRDARTTRRARAVEARGRSARTSATSPARRPRRRRAPPAKARLCWRGPCVCGGGVLSFERAHETRRGRVRGSVQVRVYRGVCADLRLRTRGQDVLHRRAAGDAVGAVHRAGGRGFRALA